MSYYTRKQLVEMLETDDAFLCALEREEIISGDAPSESSGEYSERMLERARVAQNLVHELEVNMAGAAVIVRMREEMAELRLRLEQLVAEVRRRGGD